MRPIDADALMRTISNRKHILTATNGFEDYGMFIPEIQRIIEEQRVFSTEDSRSYAEWKYLYSMGNEEIWQCTNCKTEFTFFNDPRDKEVGCNYCSICGAKMKGLR